MPGASLRRFSFVGGVLREVPADCYVPPGCLSWKNDQLAIARGALQYKFISFTVDGLVGALERQLGNVGYPARMHVALTRLRDHLKTASRARPSSSSSSSSSSVGVVVENTLVTTAPPHRQSATSATPSSDSTTEPRQDATTSQHHGGAADVTQWEWVDGHWTHEGSKWTWVDFCWQAGSEQINQHNTKQAAHIYIYI